jgi:ligand-binding sensor domain-containing protein
MRKWISFTFLIISSQAFSQMPFFQAYLLPVKNETIEIKALHQDRMGFIWIGTDKGLFKYDGFDYARYTTKDSLLDNKVTAITQDSIGRIWLGHSTGQIAYLEGDKIKQFVPLEGTATKEISDIYFDKKGVMWFSTLDDGLYYFLDNRLYRLDETDGMPDVYVYDIEECGNGKIWAGTDKGIAIVKLNNNKAEIEVLNQKDGLPDNIIKKIIFGNNNLIWLATEDGGIIRYVPSIKKFQQQIENWNFGSIRDLVIKQDQLWISTSEQGLIVIEESEMPEVQEFPGTGGVGKLLVDNEGSIWSGKNSGLLRTPGTNIQFIENFQHGMKQNIVALTVDHEKNIWFSNGEELFVMSKTKTGFTTKQLKRLEFQNSPIISLHTDSIGNVWVGSFGKGAWQFNSKGNIIHYFNQELRNGNILSICSKGKDVWFATLEGATRVRLDGATYSIKNIGSKKGLSSDYIYQVFVDSKKRIWLGTDGKDIDMLDDSGIHHFSLGDLPRVVYGFAEDGQQNIWANVQSEGLYKLDQGKFLPYRKSKNIILSALAGTANGDIAVLHEAGLEIISAREDRQQLYSDEIGLNKVGNLNAISKDQAGNIYLGTNNGIVVYRESIKDELSSPSPFIQQLKAGKHVFTNNINTSVDYESNDISIDFMGFWFQNPKALTYQYRLDNYDGDWITSRDLQTTYSRLPPGAYTFRLRTSASDGFANEKEAVWRFEIRPPFWRTFWFYGFAAIAFVLGIYLFVKQRERKLQRERSILKIKVEERTLELKTKNEEVRAQSEELQAQSSEIQRINGHLEELVLQRTAELERKNKALEEYAFINAHKLRSPVASILGLVSIMSKLPQTPETRECTDHLERSAKALDEIVGSITDAIEKAD